jgi:hypothetical protein
MTPTPDEICEELAVIAARPSTSPLNRDMMLDAKATIERLSAETAELLNDIAVMMSEFVDNWPQPKKVSTALALIAKTLRTTLNASTQGEE